MAQTTIRPPRSAVRRVGTGRVSRHVRLAPRLTRDDIESTGRKIGLRPLARQRPSVIAVPRDHPEEFKISNFVFSERFRRSASLSRPLMPRTAQEWRALMAHRALVKQIERDSDGGPTVNDNHIRIEIDGSHANAGSGANYLWLNFGSSRRLKLWGIDRTRFPAGWWIQWDLNSVADFLETVPTDAWDEIHLENPSGDGILLRRVSMVHSGVTILDWRCREWLDGSSGEAFGRIGLAAPMLQHKLAQIGQSWVPQLHWAARELGKTDWRKYGSDDQFCSEFAAWCLGKALWDVPEAAEKRDGVWGSRQMEDWFSARGRRFDDADVIAKRYRLTAGDYLRVLGGTHSALFVKYLDGDAETGPATPAGGTRIQTIEGNTSATVALRNRTVSDITAIGSTR